MSAFILKSFLHKVMNNVSSFESRILKNLLEIIGRVREESAKVYYTRVSLHSLSLHYLLYFFENFLKLFKTGEFASISATLTHIRDAAV